MDVMNRFRIDWIESLDCTSEVGEENEAGAFEENKNFDREAAEI